MLYTVIIPEDWIRGSVTWSLSDSDVASLSEMTNGAGINKAGIVVQANTAENMGENTASIILTAVHESNGKTVATTIKLGPRLDTGDGDDSDDDNSGGDNSGGNNSGGIPAAGALVEVQAALLDLTPAPRTSL